MTTKKYIAVLGGSSWAIGPVTEHATITEARHWAESYGTTADWCAIYTPANYAVLYECDDLQARPSRHRTAGRETARHVRGERGWYRAFCG